MGVISIILALIAAILGGIYTFAFLTEIYTEMETKAHCNSNKRMVNKATKHMTPEEREKYHNEGRSISGGNAG